MDSALHLSESLEDYLEAILQVGRQNPSVRPKDIARRLNVSGPSVTVALKQLAQRALINYAPYEFITFTEAGRQAAEEVCRRHEQLCTFLQGTLHVEAAQANKVACRLEHAVPGEIIDKLVRLAAFIEKCPRGGREWISGFEHLCDVDGDCNNCSRCVEEAVKRVELQKKENAAKESSRIPLTELTQGKRGRIALINLSGAALSRLLLTGATLGTPVVVDQVVSGGSSLNIRVKGVCLSISSRDASKILVDIIE